MPHICRTLIFAGLDTTSGALNRVFHLLAQHPQIQEKLRAELLAADEDLNHDKLVALPYLDAVVRESLRLSVSFRSIRSSLC